MNATTPLRAFLHPRYDAPGQVSSYMPKRSDRNARGAEAEWIRSVAAAHVASFHAGLIGDYGWTAFSAHVSVDRSRRVVHIGGDGVFERLVSRFERRLRSLIPGWRVVCAMTTGEHRAQWRIVRDQVTSLWREWPGSVSTPSLSTELVPADGPILALAVTHAGTLVRAADGTVGWVTGNLCTGRGTPGPAQCTGDWSRVARSFIGVPYKPGGTTPLGFDCSGLTQRVQKEVIGRVLPRHSSDQYVARHDGHTTPYEGQLAFTQRASGAFHVGIVIRNSDCEWSVIHASSRRGLVVEDPLEQYGARRE